MGQECDKKSGKSVSQLNNPVLIDELISNFKVETFHKSPNLNVSISTNKSTFKSFKVVFS